MQRLMHPRIQRGLRKIIDIGQLDGSSYKYIQSAAFLSLCAIWYFESANGLIAPWDKYLYPALATVLGTGAVLAFLKPGLVILIRLVTLIGVNLMIMFQITMILWWDSHPLDIYQLASTLFWFPLLFGMSFVFMQKRVAIAISCIEMLWEIISYKLRTTSQWTLATDPPYLSSLLDSALVSQFMFVVILLAIVLIKSNAKAAADQARAMSKAAQTDPLTLQYNRRGLDNALERLADNGFALLLIDIDHFKSINDTYGHKTGDQVLQELAQHSARQLRSIDIFGRWGGEEFMVIAPQLSTQQAVVLGERLRLSIAQRSYSDHKLPLTISIGIAMHTPPRDCEQCIEAADDALYQAKNNGRNQVVLAKD